MQTYFDTVQSLRDGLTQYIVVEHTAEFKIIKNWAICPDEQAADEIAFLLNQAKNKLELRPETGNKA